MVFPADDSDEIKGVLNFSRLVDLTSFFMQRAHFCYHCAVLDTEKEGKRRKIMLCRL